MNTALLFSQEELKFAAEGAVSGVRADGRSPWQFGFVYTWRYG